MGRIGLGVAGVGWLGESLIKEIGKFSTFSLAAVQDASGERAGEVAQRYASPWWGTEYAALLEAPGVDAVVICTPNAFHARQAQAALRAGRHVLVQKPLALNLDDAEETLRVAQQVERCLFVDYSYRFLETTATMRQAVAEVGVVRSFQVGFHNVYGPDKAWFFDPHLSGGGALVDLGVHLLDLALWLAQPTRVLVEEAELTFNGRHAVEDVGYLRLRLDDVPLDLRVSWNAALPLTDIFVVVEGTRGTVRWENVEGSFFRFRTLRDGQVLMDRETTLREDTLRAFEAALVTGGQYQPDLRVYDVLDRAYAGSAALTEARQPAAFIQVRAALPTEFEAVGELTATAYATDGYADPHYLATLRDAARRAANAELLVGVDGDGQLLGTVTYVGDGGAYADLAREGEAEFRMLGVLPGARRRGVAEALVRACIQRAREQGHQRLVLSTQSRMQAAHRLYSRLGFSRAPERDWSPQPDLQLMCFRMELREA